MTALILFIDNPEHARLEPALAAAMPAENEAPVYNALLDHLRNLTTLFAGEKYLYYSHYPNWNDAWDINTYRKRIQVGESLSERLRHAIEDACEDGPRNLIWMSVGAATLDSGMLEDIQALLQENDVVIGADEGGTLSLLGFRKSAVEYSLPQEINANTMAAAAASAGLSAIRADLPRAPRSADDLARIGITLG